MSERVNAVKAEMKRVGLERVSHGKWGDGSLVTGWCGEEALVSCKVFPLSEVWRVDVRQDEGLLASSLDSPDLAGAVSELRNLAGAYRRAAGNMERAIALIEAKGGE